MAFATVPSGDLAFVEGAEQVKSRESSGFGRRQFCGACGTPLTIQVDYQPETIDFPILTLDDPEKVPPEFHIFWSRHVSWFDPADGLPRHAKFRPETRGLEGTEPPDESSLSGGRG